MSGGIMSVAAVKVERGVSRNASRSEIRSTLLAAVDEIAPILAAEADKAEADRRLTDTALAALRRSGVLGLKLPRELGGFEADNALQYEVVERIAYHSTVAAWCVFIYTDIIGKVAASLPDVEISRLFEGD